MTPGRKDHRPVKDFPRTVDEAVERLIQGLPEEDKAELRSTARVDLINFHHSLGQGIRNGFGLWGENMDLLSTLDLADRWGDNASMVIIEELWSRLREEKP
jgi:hypothetical protein